MLTPEPYNWLEAKVLQLEVAGMRGCHGKVVVGESDSGCDQVKAKSRDIRKKIYVVLFSRTLSIAGISTDDILEISITADEFTFGVWCGHVVVAAQEIVSAAFSNISMER